MLVSRHPSPNAIVAKLSPLFRRQGDLNNYLKGYLLADTGKDGPWKECMFHSGGLVVDRLLAQKVRFDPTLPTSEDGDFSYRFLKSGFLAWYFPSLYYVYDQQYHNLSGMIGYWKKLGTAGVFMLKRHPRRDVAISQERALLEPLSPHYLYIRFAKVKKLAHVSQREWVILGFVRMLAMAWGFVLYGPIGRKASPRITRDKSR